MGHWGGTGMGRGLQKGMRDPSWPCGVWGAQPQVCPLPPCAHRVLAEAVVHFPQTLAEVTLGAGPGGKISLRNYMEEEAGEPCGVGVPLPWLWGAGTAP